MITFRNDAEFARMLESLPDDLHRGGVNGLHEALDDWLRRGRPLAPIDTGFGRSEMKTQIDTALMEGTLLANAYSRGFNYFHFLHEVGSQRGYRPKRAGTSLTFIKDTIDEKRSFEIVQNEIENELRSKGW